MDERDDRGELTRRELIGAAAGSAALAGAAPLLGQAPAGQAAGGAPAPPHPGTRPFELSGLGLAELRRGLESGRFTSQRLVELYLGRIEAVDRGAAGTHAVAEVNPEALALAATLDAERRAGKVRGPLHGLPILIKDNIGTADGMETTAGSLALVGARPARDAYLVGRLRAAGALLLGKTNLSEWANFRSTRSSSGWSGRGGQVHNPHALDRNPCGSSSGSAVAPAADLCAAAVGTETDGSITCPAAMNGVVGLKPTVGLVSRTGVIPISHSQDTAGPMGRTVADVAILLGGLAGTDLADPATAESAGRAAGRLHERARRPGARRRAARRRARLLRLAPGDRAPGRGAARRAARRGRRPWSTRSSCPTPTTSTPTSSRCCSTSSSTTSTAISRRCPSAASRARSRP